MLNVGSRRVTGIGAVADNDYHSECAGEHDQNHVGKEQQQ